jgi:hypothetical protein
MSAQALPYRGTPESPSNRAGITGNRAPTAIECSGCEHWWTGLAPAHCSACHETFTGVGAFDLHRRGGKCIPPAEVANRKGEPLLTRANRDWAGWSGIGSWEGPEA